MAFTKVTCYTTYCDACEREFETDYIVHHFSPEDARGDATDHDWVMVGDKIYCERCSEGKGVPCAGCDELVEKAGEYCQFCHPVEERRPINAPS